MPGSSKKAKEEPYHRKSLVVTVLEAKGLTFKAADKVALYCVVSVNNVHFNTNTVEKGQKPEWKAKFTFAENAVQPKDAQLRVILFQKQGTKEAVFGEADITLSDLVPNSTTKDWFNLNVKGDDKGKAKIQLELTLHVDVSSTQKKRSKKPTSLSRKISWGAKQTSSAQIISSSKKNENNNKKEDSSASDEESDDAYATPPDGDDTTANDQEEPKQTRAKITESQIDYIGSDNEAEIFQDQFKQATYHDETDVEDLTSAFAADEPPKPAPVQSNDNEEDHEDSAPHTESDAGTDAAEETTATVASSVDSTPTKPKKKGSKKKHVKEVVPMESVHEDDEVPEVHANGNAVAATASTPATPSGKVKKPNLFQRIFSFSPGKAKRPSERDTPTSIATYESTTTEAAIPVAPRSPRKDDPYELLREEIKAFCILERTYVHDLTVLIDEYLRPASEPPAVMKDIASLLPLVENLLNSHGSALKSIEKKLKDDTMPIGSILDNLLAEVSDSYKTYRSKQVFLLSLLDSSPNEKADHTAIMNWIAQRSETIQSQSKQIPSLQESIMAPMHRIANLAFVLEKILEYSPPIHPDLPNIRKAAARAQLLQGDLGNRGTTFKSMQKLKEISLILEFPVSNDFVLADDSSRRSYLLEGPMLRLETVGGQSRLSPIYVFLFSDNLIMCKQLANDTTPATLNSSNSSSNVHSINNNANGNNSNSTNGIGIIQPATTPRGSRSAQLLPPPAKYIVIGRIRLDRLFVVDIEDVHGEMATFAAATNPQASSSHATAAPSSAAPSSQDDDHNNAADKIPRAIEELNDYGTLIELVEIGAMIHRIRFLSKDDKKLWLRTLNSVLSGVKKAYNMNEKHYLYKLLFIQDCPPIINASENGNPLNWPHSRANAAVASRQLIDRMHSSASSPLHSLSSIHSTNERDKVKQEANAIKKEFSRQLDEANLKLEVAQAEILSLKSALKEKDEKDEQSDADGSKKKKKKDKLIGRERSMTTASSTSAVEGANGDASTLSKSRRLALAEARADEYARKFIEISSALSAKEKFETVLMEKMAANEVSLQTHAQQSALILDHISQQSERFKKEMTAMQEASTRAISQLQQQLQILTDKISSPTTPTRAASGSLSGIGGGVNNNLASPTSASNFVLNHRGSFSNNVNTTSKPPIPAKPVVTAGPSWRGSAPAPNHSNDGRALDRNSSGLIGPAQLRGARANNINNLTNASSNNNLAMSGSAITANSPGTTSILANSQPDNPGVTGSAGTDSSESSASGSIKQPATVSSQPNTSGNAAPTPGNLPSRGSRLNLNLAPAQSTAPGSAPAPLSPGGRGKERKLKNVRYTANGEETKSWTDRAKKKLGLTTTKPKNPNESTGSSGNSQPTPWRKAPVTSGSDTGPVQIKRANRVDWNHAKAEAYFSDDLGSDYDAAVHATQSDYERAQEGTEGGRLHDINSDYSEEEGAA